MLRRVLLSPRLSSASARSLHVSRPLGDAAKPLTSADAASASFHRIPKTNVHVLDSATLNTWQEIPKGGIYRGKDIVWKIWYNHAIVPPYAVSIAAAGLSSYFMSSGQGVEPPARIRTGLI